MSDNRFWYINWRTDAEHVMLTQSQMNEKLKWFRENGHLIDNRDDAGNKTRKLSWYAHDWSYCVDQDKLQINLYTIDDNFNLTVYYTMFDEDKCHRDLGVSGGGAFRLVNNMFFEKYGVSLQSAFGRCEDDFIFDKVNMSLPPIIYANEQDYDNVIYNVYKADVSSAYPFGMCGLLPDFHKKSIRRFSGVIKPNHEYPFAFYLRSGHMAIYGELDTYEDFRFHPIYSTRGKWDNQFYGDKEETILMKPSKYRLDEIMKELYDKKKDDPNIKTMMVAFIGYIRSIKSWQHHYMGHLSAVVYARHLKRMMGFYDKIVSEHNRIEMIATDSICWSGHAMPAITTKEKALGNFVSEYEKAKLIMLANGVYGLEVNGEIVCFKHQGTAVDDISVEIKKLTDIKKLKNMKLQAFDTKEKKFVLVDPVLGSKIDI